MPYRIKFMESWNGEPFSASELQTVPAEYDDAQEARESLKALLSDYPQSERRFIATNMFVVEYGTGTKALPTQTMFFIERF